MEIAEESVFQYQTIANDKWVASRYEVSARAETLTFRHHQIAAPIDNRLEWLKKAEENNWSTRLEAETRKARRLPFTGSLH